MLFDVKTLDTLQKLGLTTYEAKAYTALVTVGPTTATVLSAESEIPRTKIYGVLKRLHEEKWITVSKGKPNTYAPRYPKEVVQQQRTLFCSELEELSNNLTLLYDRQIENEALNALLIRGIDSISAKMMEMLDRVRRSVIIIDSFLSPVEIRRLNKKIIKAKKRDVTVRIIVTPPLKENEFDIEEAFLPVKNDVRLFVPPSEDLRIFDDRLDDRPGFMRQVIIDRREMLLATATADEGVPDLDSAIAIWISSASIARLIMPPMFDRLWELSKQIS
jgi:HTH-type transcriptional regulator, sugar sensing transcriptional regulator